MPALPPREQDEAALEAGGLSWAETQARRAAAAEKFALQASREVVAGWLERVRSPAVPLASLYSEEEDGDGGA